MIYLIYITTNLTNGKKYIGSHLTSNINDSYLGSGVILKKAIEKYGKSNFQREIIAQLDNINDMKELEEYYINYYNAYDSNLFYNATKYAAGITKCTWGDKISKSMILLVLPFYYPRKFFFDILLLVDSILLEISFSINPNNS